MSLAVQVQSLATRIATECKSIRTLVNGNAANLNALTTTDKTNLVAALNELKTLIDGVSAASGAQINDAAIATTTTYSSTKIEDLVSDALASVLNGAPTALDTLDELANALGDDANFAATVTNSLANRVRVDAAQGLTSPQQAQARSNISVYSQAEIGNPETDFVATFNTGLI
jgi:hypothetical protein